MVMGQKAIVSKVLFSKKRVRFFQDIKEEIYKISWTSKRELKTCTRIVLGSIFFLGFSIYFIDLLIKNFLDLLRFIIH